MNNQPFCQIPNKRSVADSDAIDETDLLANSKNINVKQGRNIVERAKLTLIRGLPGSGKSTLAKSLNAIHLEADMYFMDEKGNYKFDHLLLKEAHNWCQKQCESHLKQGNNVVIANTFIKHWEMDVYRKLAEKYKAELSLNTCVGSFNNIHGVSAQSLEKMKKNWEP